MECALLSHVPVRPPLELPVLQRLTVTRFVGPQLIGFHSLHADAVRPAALPMRLQLERSRSRAGECR